LTISTYSSKVQILRSDEAEKNMQADEIADGRSEMTEQRKVVIFKRSEAEVWVSSSAPFLNHKENFHTAKGLLEAMARQQVIWSCDQEGEKTVVVRLTKPWSEVEDQFLEHFLPGICGIDCDITIHDRGVEEPRRTYNVRINEHAEVCKRVLREDSPVAA
jgi:hypothetical protein